MKIIKYITLILVIAVTFMSCEDDQDLTKINESKTNFLISKYQKNRFDKQ